LRFIFIHHFIKKNMNPSLLLIPDRYKAAKLYSQIPDSGAGDLTFARNSNATRVNSAGLIEKVRTNELTYSNDFSNATWAKTRSSVVSGQAGYDGTNNAWAYVDTTDNSTHLMVQALSLGATLATFSIYAKAAAVDFLVFRFEGATGVDYAYFNLSNGTLGTIDSDYIDAEITPVGNGFYRCSVSRILGASGNQAIILSAQTNGTPTYAGAGTTALILQNSQAETGDIATDYIPTTTAAVSVGITADVPRLDYTGGGCPSLLLEPQRTNVLLNSEQFNLSPWGNRNSPIITANNAIAPDGTMSAESFNVSDNALSGRNQVVVLGAGTYTFSCYLKRNASSVVGGAMRLRVIADGSTNQQFITLTNDWVRYSFTFTAAVAVTLAEVLNSNINHFDAWGAQLELGSYATSYIPTLGSSVTRLADLAQKTSASALIGQTEGTIFWEIDLTIKVAVDSDDLLNLDNGSFGDTIYLYKVPDGRIACDIYVGSAQEANFILPAASVNVGIIKMALGYANNNSAFFVNGVQVGTTDTSCTIPAMNRIQLGNTAVGASFSRTSQAALYTTRLSNAELQSLTSL
jgi:uncharacterized protein YaiE (UPF0345 family)